jgi:hypothetical protein
MPNKIVVFISSLVLGIGMLFLGQIFYIGYYFFGGIGIYTRPNGGGDAFFGIPVGNIQTFIPISFAFILGLLWWYLLRKFILNHPDKKGWYLYFILGYIPPLFTAIALGYFIKNISGIT